MSSAKSHILTVELSQSFMSPTEKNPQPSFQIRIAMNSRIPA